MSPYAEDQQESNIQTMTDLFGAFRVVPIKKHQSERGELLRYFAQKLGMAIPAVASVLKSRMGEVALEDLYYLKSVCDSESQRSFVDRVTGKTVRMTFGMVFWTQLKLR